MAFKSTLGTACVCLTMINFNVDAALESRLGGLAYYDTEADLTWLADANAGLGSTFDVSDGVADGRMDWLNAMDWANSLVVDGVGGWRLPDTIDVGNDGATYTNLYQGVDFGYNITTHSEMSNMFYNVLGNLAVRDTSGNYPQPGGGLTNTGPFSNIQPTDYWSATEFAPDTTGQAWKFSMHIGDQIGDYKAYDFYAWAVQSGDVSAVPIPSAVWLFGSGLIGLIGLARRKGNA